MISIRTIQENPLRRNQIKAAAAANKQQKENRSISSGRNILYSVSSRYSTMQPLKNTISIWYNDERISKLANVNQSKTKKAKNKIQKSTNETSKNEKKKKMAK